MWFATSAGGVSRFDGKNFVTYNESNGFSNNKVYSIREGAEGKIWFGTRERGLCVYDGSEFTVVDTAQGLPHQKVWCSMLDSRNRLWFGTLGGGLAIQDDKGWKVLDANNGIHADRVYALHEASDGSYWIGSSKHGVLQVDHNLTPLRQFTDTNGLGNNRVFAIEESEDGRIWLGTLAGGLHVVDGDSIRQITTNDGLISNMVRRLAWDDRGRLWVGTDDGITIIDGDKFTNLTTNNGLQTNRIKSLHKDMEGNMWVGYDGDGTAMFKGERFLHVNDEDVLSAPTWAISEDTAGGIWFGTLGNGAFRMVDNQFEHFTVENGLPNNHVCVIESDSKGRLWLGCNYGSVAIYDGKSFEVMQVFAPHRLTSIASFHEDSNGNMWIGGSRNGVAKWDGNKLTFYGKEMKEIVEGGTGVDHDPSVFNITEDHIGNLWFCGGEGLFKYDGNKFTHFGVDDGLSQQYTYSLVTDVEGSVWIGTAGGGVNRYNGQYFNTITTEQGLSSNSIWLLVFDDEYNLWVGTEKGVDKVIFARNANNRPNFDHVAYIKNYGRNEGFIGMETSQNTAFKDRDGNIWFATIKGITRYNPRFDDSEDQAPRTYLTGMRLFLQETDWSEYTNEKIEPWTMLPQGLELPYNKNHITFEFIGIHTSNPSKVNYRYKLNGLDEQFSPPTTKNEAVYASLPPGEYTFILQACSADGACTSPELQWSFVITPPFWATWWFYLGCIVVGVGIFAAFIKRRDVSYRKQQSILERLVEMRTAELQSEKSTVEKQNKKIRSSINYAKRIQDSILPDTGILKKYVAEHFVFYKPRDIVSGDFYWIAESEGMLFVAVADCTGHGVPGALMSMIGSTLLNEIVMENRIYDPSEILRRLDEAVMKSLKQNQDSLDVQEDGMDITIVRVEEDRSTVTFAGANHQLYHIADGELIVRQGSINSIGGIFGGRRKKNFENEYFSIEPGDCFYMLTDGFADQFGGIDNTKFMTMRFKQMIQGSYKTPMNEQLLSFQETFHNWKGVRKQVDDVLIVGIRF